MHIIRRNIEVPGGEIDLLALDGGTRVAVEVRASRGRSDPVDARASRGRSDPVDAIDPAKRRHLADIARGVGAQRVDYIGVGIGQSGMDVHWVPG